MSHDVHYTRVDRDVIAREFEFSRGDWILELFNFKAQSVMVISCDSTQIADIQKYDLEGYTSEKDVEEIKANASGKIKKPVYERIGDSILMVQRHIGGTKLNQVFNFAGGYATSAFSWGRPSPALREKFSEMASLEDVKIMRRRLIRLGGNPPEIEEPGEEEKQTNAVSISFAQGTKG